MKKLAVPIGSLSRDYGEKIRMEDALKYMETAYESGADIVELRIDSIADVDLEKLIFHSPLPVIVTNRVKSEGGNFEGSEWLRMLMLKEAVNLNANYVDLELNYLPENFEKKKSRLIVSYHNFNETPENLHEIYGKILNTNADIIKIAVKSNSEKDNERIIEMTRYSQKPIIGIGMGEIGKITRLNSINEIDYVSLPGQSNAPGQFNIDEVKKAFKFE